MAFNKKMQDVLTLFVDRIKKLGDNFDFLAEARSLDKMLVDSGIKMNSAQFLNEIFEELEHPKSSWRPNKDELNILLKALPDRIKKGRVSKDILVKYIPRSDWELFASSSLSSLASSYKKKLGTSPVILSKYYGDNLNCNVFLGDIGYKLGLRRCSNFESMCYAIDKSLGMDVVMAELSKRIPQASIKVIDFPNGSNLCDAKYEFFIESDKSKPFIEKQILLTLQEIGIA